ncbi:MAG: cyclase family protein [Candidatus Limnocylindria bacterium]
MCLAETHEAVRERLDAPAHQHQGTPVSRRAVIAGGLGASIGALAIPSTAAAAPRGRRMRDLTWTFSPSFPVFVDGEEATRSTHVTIEENGYYLQRWTFYEHTATHMDAPGHFAPGGRLSPDISLDELLVPAVVIDISDKVASDSDAEVTVDDLIRYERRHGRIARRSAVLMYSGWETRAGSTELYRGTDSSGTYHFPGFDLEAIEWLVERRNITGIGVDTLSLDHGPSATFDVHVGLLGADRWGLENLRNTGTIPPRGAEIFVGLVPWEQGSGGPCRVIAHW